MGKVAGAGDLGRITGALGKEDRIFMGDLDIELDCSTGACATPTLFEGLDAE